MHPHLLSILLMTTLFVSAPFQVECKSLFGIGTRQPGDTLRLRDEIENRHTGLTEVPVIAFNYVVREPITCIEIESDQNVQADVNFSYYNALVNGTVSALSTTLQEENKPFKILISIYAFTEKMPKLNEDGLLRQQFYNGSLVPSLESDEIDHMEVLVSNENLDIDEALEGLEFDAYAKASEENNEEGEKDLENKPSNEHEDEYEVVEDDDDEDENRDEDVDEGGETFESTDNIMTVGDRQLGDELVYETYQTSHAATTEPTSHNVTFYFIDDVNITHLQFVIIDYFNNKSIEDTSNLKLIEYSHFTSSTFKAVVRDHKTTSLFAKMSVYGYRPENLPITYVSYIPEKVRPAAPAPITTESPESHLRKQINSLQRDDLPELPSSFNMLRREGEIQYTVTNAIDENSPTSNAATINALHSQITNLSVMMPLGILIVVYRLLASVVSFA